jgi:hypothetical protein
MTDDEDPGAIGGRRAPGEDTPDAPVREAGGGVAEGFEEAEELLIEHASHGDEHAARRALQDAPAAEPEEAADAYAEADTERTSERDEDDEEVR